MLRLLVLAAVAAVVILDAQADNAHNPEQNAPPAPAPDQAQPEPAAPAQAQAPANSGPMLKWKEIPVEKPPVEISTQHIPGTLGSLGLTTGDLKLYAGHALNLLKAKCPNVNHHTLFKVHKYIGKRITEANPVPGDNQKLKTLLGKMMQCAAKGPTPPQKEEPKKIDAPAPEGEKEQPSADTKSDNQAPVTPKKKWTDMTIEERASEIGHLFVHTETKKLEEKPTPAPTPKVEATTERPKPRRNPIMAWLANAMESISSFFRGIFGFGRGRRSTDEQESGSPRFILTVYKPSHDSDATDLDQPKTGQEAFLTLFDQMCRIYCDMCPGPNQSTDFKIAAKELLQFLFKEDSKTGMDLAAEHYLNHEFLQSVFDCA